MNRYYKAKADEELELLFKAAAEGRIEEQRQHYDSYHSFLRQAYGGRKETYVAQMRRPQ